VLAEEHDFNDAFNISLALRFRELSCKLYDMGCYDKAVEAAEESVAIYQHPSTKCSLPASIFLTYTLNDLSKYRSRLGRQNESLEAAREAVVVCRSLPARNPSTEYANSNGERLSASLNSLAKSLSNLGYSEEALKTAEEAVVTSELLVTREPAKYNIAIIYSHTRYADSHNAFTT
jgi:tetratricopeptide (TPR) repeat protein